MSKKLFSAGIGLMFLLSPLLVSAQTIADLVAKLQEIIAQVGGLQSQLAAVSSAVNSPSASILTIPASGEVVPNEYIVVLKGAPAKSPSVSMEVTETQPGVTATSFVAGNNAKKRTLKAKHKYSHVLNGFSATLSSQEVADLKNDPLVAYITPNRKVYALQTSSQITPTGINRVEATNLSNIGMGVDVAVIDTGIDATHPDLAGKIVGGTNCVDPSSPSYADDFGHGTHVAGTIAANNNTIGVVGVAPGANLWAVKVLNQNGSGTWDQVICGIDFVASKGPANGGPIKVANMSLGGGGTSDNNCGATNGDAMHAAICTARDAGVTFVVAAGNSARDSAGFVPAAYDDAVITVSALNDSDGLPGGLGVPTSRGADDTFAYFSNYGSIVDIGAPGVDILSTVPATGNGCCSDPSRYKLLSGTSMASPHVAGVAALYVAEHPTATWTEIRDALIAQGELPGPDTHSPKDSNGNIAHPEPVLLAKPSTATRIRLSAPTDNPYIKVGETVSIGWNVMNALENSQVVLLVKNIKPEPEPLRSRIGSGMWQSALLPVGESTGFYNWLTGPNRLTLPGQYEITAQIRACDPAGCDNTSTSTLPVYATSNLARFYLYEDGKIFVTAPNGGEKWELGVINTVTWSPYNYDPVINPSPNVSAYLEKRVNSVFVPVGRIIAAGKASIHWDGLIITSTTTKYADPGVYWIRVVNDTTGATDRSNTYFTLQPRPVDLKINGSDGPLSVLDNQQITLSWKSVNMISCNVYNVRLAQGGGPENVYNLPTSGTLKVYAYIPPWSATGVTLACYRNIGGTYTYFYDSVTLNANPNPPSLTVTSPNSGEKIEVWKPYTIRWDYSGLQKISIALYKNDKWLEWIKKDLPVLNTPVNSYTWTPTDGVSPEPPRTGEGNVFKIYITGQKADGSGSIEDKSDLPFSFVTPAATGPTITGLDAPIALRAGETGTWTIHVSVSEQTTQLSYNVVWGDEIPSQAGASNIQTSATFTHVYQKAGTYTPKFTVSNSAGSAETSATVTVSGGTAAGSLTATKSSGYGNQTISAGTKNAKIGSFTLTTGSTEGVNVNNIVINFSSAEAAQITDLRLVDNMTEAQIGPSKVLPATSNAFVVNVNIATSETKRVDVIANVKSNSSGSLSATVGARTGGTGLSTGTATTIGSDVELQTITFSSGSLKVTRDSGTPVSSNVIAGTPMIPVGKFDFSASSTSYTVQELKIKIPADAATSVGAVTLKYKDSKDIVQTRSQAFTLPFGTQTHATATFTGLDFYVPLNGSADLDVSVDIPTIASGAKSGAAISVLLDANEGFKAVDASGGSDTSLATIDVRSNAAGYGTKYVKKSIPTLTRLTTGYTPDTVASGVGLYRFTLAADSAGAIEWRKLIFKVSMTGATISRWTLYDVTASTTPVNSRPVNVSVNGFLQICPDTSCTIGEAQRIGAGEKKIYELRPGVVTGWGQAGDSITISFAGDIRPVPNATALAQIGRMVWSDLSALSHSTTTTDWTNGYLVKDTDNDTRSCLFFDTATTCTSGNVVSVDQKSVIENVAASLVALESILRGWLAGLSR